MIQITIGRNLALKNIKNVWVHRRCNCVIGLLEGDVESFHCIRCLDGISQVPAEAGMRDGIKKLKS